MTAIKDSHGLHWKEIYTTKMLNYCVVSLLLPVILFIKAVRIRYSGSVAGWWGQLICKDIGKMLQLCLRFVESAIVVVLDSCNISLI